MPMVSKLTSAFRTLIGSDSSPPSPAKRKRTWASSNHQHAQQDILETPQPKRSKLGNEESITSPIGKVANWIKKKASTFGENYFFRPLDMQNGFESHAEDGTVTDCRGPVIKQDLRRRPLDRSPMATVSYDPIPEERPPKAETRLANGPDVRRKDARSLRDGEDVSASRQSHTQKKSAIASSVTNGNGASSRTKSMLRVRERQTVPQPKDLPSRKSHTITFSSRSQDVGEAKDKPYTSVNQKLFSQEPVRQSSVSSDDSRTQSTANECVRLDQLQHYQQLLQQFTTMNVDRFSPSSQLSIRDSSQEASRDTTRSVPQEPTEAVWTAQRARVPATKTFHRTRVLPHQYESKREIREAARHRLHAPVTDLSPSATPYTSRLAVSTPAQPDFTARSESPVILSVQSPPVRSSSFNLSSMTSFERSLTETPFAMADWVKDMKERFESSVRLQQRNIEKEKAMLSVYKQQRDEQTSRISKKILEDMKLAERRAAVMKEPPTPEISEEEEEEEEDEEEEEEDLPAITNDMNNEINNALRAQPSNQVLTEGFRLRLTRNDMHTLYGLNWLNDEIINFYMNLLVERGDEQGRMKLHCFNTFFYPKLLKEGQTGLRRWTKKTDIFAKDMILVPIHLGMHWCMAIIDFRKKTISYFDSMGKENRQCLEALRKYLIDEHQDKKGSSYDVSGWACVCAKDIPQQMNGSDCGMFACKFADYISQDKRITFTQHDMPYFRRRMVWELLHKKLL